MTLDMRAVIAGLASGASTLGANINRRREKREDEEQALKLLAAKPSKENTQVVTGTDENGPGIFLVDKDKGTKKRITDEAMAALTGAPVAPRQTMLRSPGMPMPETAPPIPESQRMPTSTVPVPEDMPHDVGAPSVPSAMPAPRTLGLQPIPRAEPKPAGAPRRTPRSIMVDGKPMEASYDGYKYFDQAGNEIKGAITPYAPPKDAPLVTAVDASGNPVRAVDKPGLQMPSASSSGAAGLKVKAAEHRATIRAIDAALVELEKQPKATGGKLRALGDIVPQLATGISMYDQNEHPELVPAQAQIANVGSLIIGERSGKAVTVAEFPRLAPFIPLRGDSPQVVKVKLTELKKQINLLVEEMGITAPSPGGSAKPSDDDDAEFTAMMATVKKAKPPV